jgi:hypothetical protein
MSTPEYAETDFDLEGCNFTSGVHFERKFKKAGNVTILQILIMSGAVLFALTCSATISAVVFDNGIASTIGISLLVSGMAWLASLRLVRYIAARNALMRKTQLEFLTDLVVARLSRGSFVNGKRWRGDRFGRKSTLSIENTYPREER